MVSSCLAACSSQAADLEAPPRPPIVKATAPTLVDWSGVYFGAHAGHLWADAEWSASLNGLNLFGADLAGAGEVGARHRIEDWLGGGQLGFNRQSGPWVYGLEVSLSGSDAKGGSFGPVDDIYRTKIPWLLLVAGRVGYASGPWLPYVKAGYALASVRAETIDPTQQRSARARGKQAIWTTTCKHREKALRWFVSRRVECSTESSGDQRGITGRPTPSGPCKSRYV